MATSKKGASQLIRQTMFATGEVDTQNFKRSDVQEYLTAAQSLLNCEVGTTGLAKKRKGTALKADMTTRASFTTKMYELVDNNGNHYIIFSAAGGFFVYQVYNESDILVTSRGTTVVTGRSTTVVVGSLLPDYVSNPVWPYTDAQLAALDYTQDNDSVIFTNNRVAPGRVYVTQYNGTDFPTFGYMPLNIYPLPAYDFSNINYNNYNVEYQDQGDGTMIFTLNVGATDPGFATTSPSPWINGQIIGGGASAEQPLGEMIITAVSYANPYVTFTGTIIQPFATAGANPKGSGYSIKQPAWSDALGYPGKVLYYQNRLWMANTPSLKTTIFGSKINQPISFDVGTGLDTDAIIYTLGQSDSGAITWMNGGKQLEIFTTNYEFAAPQDQNQALTPTTFSIRQQSSFGVSTTLKPVSYINDSYYVSKSGSSIINFHFTGVGLAYQASNISAASSHLVGNPQNRALLRGGDTSQDNFIYFLNNDSSITAFQFANEYKLAALSPVKFEEDVEVIDICTVQNIVYFLKYYAKTKKFILEAFDNTTRMDCTSVGHMASTGVINGLSLYEGYTIQVTYLNQDFGQYMVTNGTITVYNPNQYVGTVQVGLLYDVVITPMYIYGGTQNSPYKKTISRIYVDYFNSLDFAVNGILVPYQNYAEIMSGSPLVPQTGTAIVDSSDGWERYETISITQTSPFDLQVLSIGYQVAVSYI